MQKLPRFLALALCALLLAAAPSTAVAKVLATGKPSPGGFYWQKIKKTSGSIQSLCRKKGVGTPEKDAACNGARAVRPK
ncbi:MAG: hypothetical protein VKI83_07865 [Synechococcaceae cyanobacterium]|nr:hypothetical protein [Synechococcaceae cyanobacterium]